VENAILVLRLKPRSVYLVEVEFNYSLSLQSYEPVTLRYYSHCVIVGRLINILHEHLSFLDSDSVTRNNEHFSNNNLGYTFLYALDVSCSFSYLIYMNFKKTYQF